MAEERRQRIFWVAVLLSLLRVDARTSGQTPLGIALEEAVRPILVNMSRDTGINATAWGFAYHDATTRVALCVGPTADNVTAPRACDNNSKFAYGSGTKPFTSVLINQLVHAGKMSLDEPVSPIVKPFIDMGIFGPHGHSITSRQLLRHHSGIHELVGEPLRVWQNTHPGVDIDPMTMLLNWTNHTLICPPGQCGVYSSAGYTLLGLVAAGAMGVTRWDELDQRVWLGLDQDQTKWFAHTFFPTHGPCRNFSTAVRGQTAGSIHGYEHHFRRDVYNVSCVQGWTCGNMVARPSDVAAFWFLLLGGGRPGRAVGGGLVGADALHEMTEWRNISFGGCWPNCKQGNFSYGLGIMDFNTMRWGFGHDGKFLGHNGLTYGFGTESGYNYDLDFALSWANNHERLVGPDHFRTSPRTNAVYMAVVEVVKAHRHSS